MEIDHKTLKPALMSISFIGLLFLISGCSSKVPEVKADTNFTKHQSEEIIVDVHAHFFNALDIEKGNFIRMTSPKLKGWLSGSNLITTRIIEPYTNKRKNRLLQDSVRNDWFQENNITIPLSLTTFNDPNFGTGSVYDFIEAAATSRQGLALAYFENYPEVNLVTPSMVDFQGFSEPGYNVINKRYEDTWSTDFNASDIYEHDTRGRHNFQRKLASDFNKEFGNTHAILPIAGFNPMRGVVDSCKETDCKKRFAFFQWSENNTSAYANEFLNEFVNNENNQSFLGIKIYPQIGYYPFSNCKNVLRNFEKFGKDNPLPYAPIVEIGLRINDSDVSTSCSELKEVMEEKGWYSNEQNQLGFKLASAFDKQLNTLWLSAYENGFPVVTHTGHGGSKHGNNFEKYGTLDVWKSFDRDLKELIYEKEGAVVNCSKTPVRVLLGHSWADEQYNTENFKEVLTFAYQNLMDKSTCVNFYLDFSDSYIGSHIDQFNKLLRDSSMFVIFHSLLKEGRILYGSDYFMNVLDSDNAPNEYLNSHLSWLNRLSIPKNEQKNYLSDAALEFLGLSFHSKQCDKAKAWFEDDKIPKWLLDQCAYQDNKLEEPIKNQRAAF